MKPSQIFSGCCIAFIVTINILRMVYQIGPQYEKQVVVPADWQQPAIESVEFDPIQEALRKQLIENAEQAFEQIRANAEAESRSFDTE